MSHSADPVGAPSLMLKDVMQTVIPYPKPVPAQREPGAIPPPARQPDVSFIIAAYNVASFIEEAIDSALGQQGVNVELIVADDASTDGTADIVATHAQQDSRIHLIRRTQNAGPAAARNQAIAKASGRWIAMFDGDDIIAPERSRRLIDLAEALSVDMVADNYERVRLQGQPTGITMIPRGQASYAFSVDAATFMQANAALARPGLTLGAVKAMVRADFLRAQSLQQPEALAIGEDYHFCLSCLLAGAQFAVTSDVHYFYRMRDSSISWRWTSEHIEALLAAHEAEQLERRFGEDVMTMRAAQTYERSLRRALSFARIVETAKQRRWLEALALAASSRMTWPLIGRFGTQAVMKRVRRRMPFMAADQATG